MCPRALEKPAAAEPMCQTSEPGEHLYTRAELLPICLEIGRRMLKLFGYQGIRQIVFRLKSNPDEINSVIDGHALPSTELLLGMQKVTGVSIDWLLTGKGTEFLPAEDIQADGRTENADLLPFFIREERRRPPELPAP